METFPFMLASFLVTVLLVRLLLLPVKWIFKIGIHACCGFLCLWLLNTAAPVTGIPFPVNGVTVLAAGFGGLPAIGLLALLAGL